MKVSLFFFILFFSLCSCNKEEGITETKDIILTIPSGFPEIAFPNDNALTSDRWQLGKQLFYDTRLSKDGTISCASCHLPSLAFSDLLPKSIGVNNLIGRRNAPTLANVAYLPYFTREGGVPSLEMQILVPIQEHDEFGHNIVDIVSELKNDNQLNDLSLKAYDQNLDAFVLTRAIATFERSIISGNSYYDRNELTEAQKRGKQLFFSEKTNCSKCHSGFNFTNNEILNNGLYENYDDPGRYRLTGLESDKAKFKVPTLRNIEVTAPYMFDGSLETLEKVVDHYISGGKNHQNKSDKIVPLSLSKTEKSDLIAFLKALTDQEFLNNKIYSNE